MLENQLYFKLTKKVEGASKTKNNQKDKYKNLQKDIHKTEYNLESGAKWEKKIKTILKP